MNISFYHSELDSEREPISGWSYLGQLGVANMIKIKFHNGPWVEVRDLGNGEYAIREPVYKQHGVEAYRQEYSNDPTK